MVHRWPALAAAAVALAVTCLGATAGAADAPLSGLQPGDSMPAFNVQDVTGLAKGGRICYV